VLFSALNLLHEISLLIKLCLLNFLILLFSFAAAQVFQLQTILYWLTSSAIDFFALCPVYSDFNECTYYLFH